MQKVETQKNIRYFKTRTRRASLESLLNFTGLQAALNDSFLEIDALAFV